MATALVIILSVLGAIAGLFILLFALLGIVRLRNEYHTWGYYVIKEDMSGKVAVVTGGTAGLGFETSKELAKAGATVVWGVRNLNKAESRKAELLHANPESKIEAFELEMGSLASAEKFVSEVSSKFNKIDLLVCNAGMGNQDRTAKTIDGFEVHFGINYLAHFFIIRGLMDNMMNSGTLQILLKCGTLSDKNLYSPLFQTLPGL